mgnify:CR=1 FL=1
MEGFVKWYNRKKGFGFIKGEDNEDYFVHYTQLAEKVFLRENDKVTFEAVDTEKGKQAQNVDLLQKASEMTEQPAAEAPMQEQPSEEEAPEEQSESFGEEEKEEPAETAEEPEKTGEEPKDTENFGEEEPKQE